MVEIFLVINTRIIVKKVGLFVFINTRKLVGFLGLLDLLKLYRKFFLIINYLSNLLIDKKKRKLLN